MLIHDPPEKTAYHEHPIKILRYSAKNLWLLIFPLLRSLRFYRSPCKTCGVGCRRMV